MKMSTDQREFKRKVDKAKGLGWRISGVVLSLLMVWWGNSFFEIMVVYLVSFGIAELCDLNAQARKTPWE